MSKYLIFQFQFNVAFLLLECRASPSLLGALIRISFKLYY